MSEHPFAVVTRGLSPLGLSVGYALRKDFAVAFFDKYDEEKRNKIVADGLSYSFLKNETEEGILQTLQAVMVCFANVRVLVNIIEPKDIIKSSAFKAMSAVSVKEKVSAYLEGTVALIKVITLQMASQPEREGFKGHVINIINWDADSDLLSSMVCGAVANMTAPLAKALQNYNIRVNSIVIDPCNKARGVVDDSQLIDGLTSSDDVLSVVQSVIQETSYNAVNFRVRGVQVRL
jgi:NAD(P)-dependent dehydrogenase (short-subunit alcohol dehydrogenase family)